MKKNIQGVALALTVSGILPGIVCAAALSCDWLLDALPCAGAILGAGAIIQLWRWSIC